MLHKAGPVFLECRALSWVLTARPECLAHSGQAVQPSPRETGASVAAVTLPRPYPDPTQALCLSAQ